MSSRLDLIIRRGSVVTPEGVTHGDVAVAEGKIASVAANIAESAEKEIDARGLHVFPAVLDAHVHFNEPGRTEWEGFETATRAAAAGGGAVPAAWLWWGGAAAPFRWRCRHPCRFRRRSPTARPLPRSADWPKKNR